MINLRYLTFVVLSCTIACSGEETPQPMENPDPLPHCKAEVLPADWTTQGPLGGPGVDMNGELMPGNYIASTTYLRLKVGAATQERFNQLLGPIVMDLMAQPDLVAMQTGSSVECSTARTLTIWKSEEGMYNFVRGAAHSAAVSAVSEVSRGGSITGHWMADEKKATWEEALVRLKDHQGPIY